MLCFLAICNASQDGFSTSQTPSKQFKDPEGDILQHKPRGAGVSICDSSLLAVPGQDEHLIAPHEEVAMPVRIAHLVVNELDSIAGDVSHDVQQVVKRLLDVQRVSKQFLDARNIPPDATSATHHGKVVILHQITEHGVSLLIEQRFGQE
ncbi:hypothetical protein BD769DRAFT_1663118 [Suillus cothurnatus]|nr:hypothetical protein BD769DRAFT_1663118 [Suillus cothurnatus]